MKKEMVIHIFSSVLSYYFKNTIIYISVYCVTVSGLKTIVELLIRSHDCFTASCNMEGIASVLRKCQNLANTLQILKHWALLVRLLISYLISVVSKII